MRLGEGVAKFDGHSIAQAKQDNATKRLGAAWIRHEALSAGEVRKVGRPTPGKGEAQPGKTLTQHRR